MGQHHPVHCPAEVAVPHQLVAAAQVAAGVHVRLVDPDAGAGPLLHRRERDHDDFRIRCRLRGGEDSAVHSRRPAQRLVPQLLAGVEVEGPRVPHLAARAHHVQVAVHARPGLGVVVVEAKRVRLGLFHEIGDVAVLEGALTEVAVGPGVGTIVSAGSAAARRRRDACARGARGLREHPGGGDRQRPCPHGIGERLPLDVHEADADPAIGLDVDL